VTTHTAKKNTKILVVDDDKNILRVINDLLKKHELKPESFRKEASRGMLLQAGGTGGKVPNLSHKNTFYPPFRSLPLPVMFMPIITTRPSGPGDRSTAALV